MRPNTLAEAVRRIETGESPARAFSELLDSFYGAPTPDAQLAVLAEAPAASGDARLDAYVAAAAEYLCKQGRLAPVPAWVVDPARILSEPWFTGPAIGPSTGPSTDPLAGTCVGAEFAAFLIYSSPAEFRARNIFTEARPLRRARATRRC